MLARKKVLGVSLVVALCVPLAVLAGPAQAASHCTGTTTITCTYLSTGGEQTFVVPAGVTSINVVAIGGKGADGDGADGDGGAGGFGAKVQGDDLAVTSGNTLYVHVALGGGAGEGFNPGGDGGGGSDIRTVTGTDAATLASRLVVAGGGGGGGAYYGGVGGNAGQAGGNAVTGSDIVPASGAVGGGAGSNVAGGAGGAGTGGATGLTGVLGSGGAGGDGFFDGGGAGGGGYWGGGGGGGNNAGSLAGGGGGGGGSSYTGSLTNSAVTTDDTGVASVIISYTLTPPGAPTDVTADPGDQQVTVSWVAPASDGGSAITGYTVTGSPSGSCTTSMTSCVITGLTNGTAYTFTVVATNTIGNGPVSAGATATPTASVPPTTPPGAPRDVTADPGDQQVTVSWVAPASDGGSAITGYTVTGSPSGSCTTSMTSCVITGLTNGTAYTFTVVATNTIGNGPVSAGATATPTASVPPTTPTTPALPPAGPSDDAPSETATSVGALGGGRLPATGTTADALVILAGLLCAAGAALFAFSRRRAARI
jgi:LPXTG-motif cell wall-anchored protein